MITFLSLSTEYKALPPKGFQATPQMALLKGVTGDNTRIRRRRSDEMSQVLLVFVQDSFDLSAKCVPYE